MTGNCSSTNTVMMTRAESEGLQRWRIRKTKQEGRRRSNFFEGSFQLINVGSGRLMNAGGISDFTLGLDENSAGFSTLRAAGGVIWDVKSGGNAAASRGWTLKDGAVVKLWKEGGSASQRFKLELLADLGTSTSPCD